MSNFQLPSWSARNPLGIVALFISLIYGVSALLLGTSVDNLLPRNQDRLVFFIVLFPIAVLGAFLWLVSRHHRKLYGPGDFRTDEGFLGVERPPEALGEKYISEGDATTEEADALPDPAEEQDELAQESEAEAEPSPESARTSRIAQAYLIEGLAFQELQKEFSGSVRREVAVRTPRGTVIMADGVIETPTLRILVEVLHLRRRKNLTNTVVSTIARMINISKEMQSFENVRIAPLVAIVIGDNVDEESVKRIVGISPGIYDDVIVRTYRSSELLVKYGISLNQTSEPSTVPPAQ